MKTLQVVCSECSSVNSIEINKEKDTFLCATCQEDLDNPFPVEATDMSARTHIVENEIAVLVDFYSTTCGPCMAMYEDYEDAALEFGLSVRFLKINADEHQELAREYGVSALPTLIAFSKAKEVNRVSSQLSRVELVLWAQKLIS